MTEKGKTRGFQNVSVDAWVEMVRQEDHGRQRWEEYNGYLRNLDIRTGRLRSPKPTAPSDTTGKSPERQSFFTTSGPLTASQRHGYVVSFSHKRSDSKPITRAASAPTSPTSPTALPSVVRTTESQLSQAHVSYSACPWAALGVGLSAPGPEEAGIVPTQAPTLLPALAPATLAKAGGTTAAGLGAPEFTRTTPSRHQTLSPMSKLTIMQGISPHRRHHSEFDPRMAW